MIEIRIDANQAKDTLQTKQLIGKEIRSRDGSVVGKVYSLMIDPHDLSVQGITAYKGMFASDYYIGKEYIESITKDGIMLNIVPKQYFKDKAIIDAGGRHVGTVRHIETIDASNDLFRMMISDRQDKDMTINEHLIDEIGEEILLKK